LHNLGEIEVSKLCIIPIEILDLAPFSRPARSAGTG
jgi:hypothetical protein